jgi:hypothetical protein
MNKKTLLSFVCATAAAFALASCGTAETSSSSSIAEPTQYAISFEGEHGTSNLPATAKEGKAVFFKITLEEGYELASVSATYSDGATTKAITLSGDNENGYGFEMVAYAVKVVASINAITPTYAIDFDGGDNAFAAGLPIKAAEGDELSFLVTVTTGYELTDFSVYYTDAKGSIKYVPYTGSAVVGYKFTMVPQAVTVKADASAVVVGSFHAIASDAVSLNYKDEDYKAGDMVEKYLDADGNELPGGYAKVGETVKLVMSRSSIVKVDQFQLDVAPLSMDESGDLASFTFVMPAHDPVLTATISPFKTAISVVASENYDATLWMEKDVDGNPIVVTEAVDSDVINVTVDVKVPEDYALSKISANYVRYDSRDARVTTEGSFDEVRWGGSSYYKPFFTKVDDTTMSFEIVPTYYMESMEIVITLKDLGQWKNAEFLGSYTGFEIDGGKKYGSSIKSVTVAATGEIAGFSSSSDTFSAYDETTGKITGEDYKYFYNNGVIMRAYSSYSGSMYSDCYVVMKGITNFDNVKYEIYYDEDSQILFVNFTETVDGADVAIGSAAAIGTKGYPGATIVVNDGGTFANGDVTVTFKGTQVYPAA